MAAAAVLALFFVTTPVYASPDLISVLVNGKINPTIVSGSTAQLDNIFTAGPLGGVNTIEWIAVEVPSHLVYVFIPPGIGNVINFFGAAGDSNACVVPFGGPGSLQYVVLSGTPTQSGCSSSYSNPLWHTTTETASQVQADCSASGTPTVSAAVGNGDTSLSGYYVVMACYNQHNPFVTQFSSAYQVFRAPEFGSFAAVMAIGVALVVLRRRMFPPGTLAPDSS